VPRATNPEFVKVLDFGVANGVSEAAWSKRVPIAGEVVER